VTLIVDFYFYFFPRVDRPRQDNPACTKGVTRSCVQHVERQYLYYDVTRRVLNRCGGRVIDRTQFDFRLSFFKHIDSLHVGHRRVFIRVKPTKIVGVSCGDGLCSVAIGVPFRATRAGIATSFFSFFCPFYVSLIIYQYIIRLVTASWLPFLEIHSAPKTLQLQCVYKSSERKHSQIAESF
jgi:hypothetical protein